MLRISGEEVRGVKGTTPTLSLLFHLSPSTISLWLAEAIMGKRDSGDPPPSFCAHQISSAKSEPRLVKPEPQGKAKKGRVWHDGRVWMWVKFFSHQTTSCWCFLCFVSLEATSCCFYLLLQAHHTWEWPWASKGYHDCAFNDAAHPNVLITNATIGLAMHSGLWKFTIPHQNQVDWSWRPCT